MKDRQVILQHYQKSEQDFVERIYELCQFVDRTSIDRLTDFLNPRQVMITESIAGKFNLFAHSSGHHLPTEYCRVIISTSDQLPEFAGYEISILEVDFNRKFHQLSHSQILGTLLNRLGIQRKFLGDIFINDQEILLFIDEKFSTILLMDVERIAKVPVKWKMRTAESVSLEHHIQVDKKVILASSLRLDKLVAAAFQLSRSAVVKLIESNKVKVDYAEISQVSKTLEIGQLVSVRGFGRFRLVELLGTSKQGKFKIEIEVTKV
ncbi:RNA-binding protein [Streptococcus suis]